MLLEILIDIAELLAVCAFVALAAYLLTRIAEGNNHNPQDRS
jgi:flagellar biogenesis protein FliO